VTTDYCSCYWLAEYDCHTSYSHLGLTLGRSGPNLEPGTMRVYLTNGPRNGLNSGRKVGPCPGRRRWWVLSSVHAFSRAVHDANTYRPRFHVRTRPYYLEGDPSFPPIWISNYFSFPFVYRWVWTGDAGEDRRARVWPFTRYFSIQRFFCTNQ